MNEITHHNAYDLFQVEAMQRVNFPFNLSFSKKNDEIEIKALGYFYLTYKKKIIYIGFSEGNEDVIEMRFKKQLESISLRSTRLSFSDVAFRTFQDSNNFNSFSIPQEKTGCEVSSKKVQFADENWNDFSRFDNEILKEFDFYWFNCSGFDLVEAKSLIEQARQTHNPICNG